MIEQQLKEHFARATGGGQVDVDVAGLARLGRRERTRRRVGGVAAVAAAAVVVGGTAFGVSALGGDEPRGLDPVAPAAPAASDPHLPWMKGRTLHVGDVEVPFRRLAEFTYAAGVTVATLETAPRSWDLVMVRDGEVTRLAQASTEFLPFQFGLAADGSTVAWSVAIEPDPALVTVYDVGTGRLLGTQDVPIEWGGCCTGEGQLTLNGVDSSGRVVWSIDGRPTVWRPGTEPVAVPGVSGLISLRRQHWPGGLMYQGEGTGFMDTPGVYGTVAEDGTFTEVGRTAVDQIGAWAPQGDLFAYEGGADATMLEEGHLWLQDDGADPVEVSLPQPLEVLIGWTSDTEVGVQLADRSLWTCDVVTGSCADTGDVVAEKGHVPGE